MYVAKLKTVLFPIKTVSKCWKLSKFNTSFFSSRWISYVIYFNIFTPKQGGKAPTTVVLLRVEETEKPLVKWIVKYTEDDDGITLKLL